MEAEFVAAIEGVAFPFFGLAYSIDKIQFNLEHRLDNKIDSSKNSIRHA
jgi:hypothetical protein